VLYKQIEKYFSAVQRHLNFEQEVSTENGVGRGKKVCNLMKLVMCVFNVVGLKMVFSSLLLLLHILQGKSTLLNWAAEDAPPFLALSVGCKFVMYSLLVFRNSFLSPKRVKYIFFRPLVTHRIYS